MNPSRENQEGFGRLDKVDGFRAYYRITRDEIVCVVIEEVNKHDYKAIERLFGI